MQSPDCIFCWTCYYLLKEERYATKKATQQKTVTTFLIEFKNVIITKAGLMEPRTYTVSQQ